MDKQLYDAFNAAFPGDPLDPKFTASPMWNDYCKENQAEYDEIALRILREHNKRKRNEIRNRMKK